MATTLPRIGDVYSISGTGSRNSPSDSHAFICVAVSAAGDAALLVPMCSFHAACDRTCEISTTDYGGLSHGSYAAYFQAREVTVKQWDVFALGNQLKKRAAVSATLLARVRKGMSDTDELPQWIEKLWEKWK